MKPRVKICGVTSSEEALLAVDLGADFVGLNFYPPSPRFLETPEAAEIASAVRGRAKLVGVFVDRPRRDRRSLCRAKSLLQPGPENNPGLVSIP